MALHAIVNQAVPPDYKPDVVQLGTLLSLNGNLAAFDSEVGQSGVQRKLEPYANKLSLTHRSFDAIVDWYLMKRGMLP